MGSWVSQITEFGHDAEPRVDLRAGEPAELGILEGVHAADRKGKHAAPRVARDYDGQEPGVRHERAPVVALRVVDELSGVAVDLPDEFEPRGREVHHDLGVRERRGLKGGAGGTRRGCDASRNDGLAREPPPRPVHYAFMRIVGITARLEDRHGLPNHRLVHPHEAHGIL